MDLRLRKRKINLFDLEERILPGIKYIQDIIESNVKYSESTNNKIYYSLDLEKLCLKKEDKQKDVYCLSNENKENLQSYLNKFLKCNVKEDFGSTDLKKYSHLFRFENSKYVDISLYLSTEKYKFFGFPGTLRTFKKYVKESNLNYNGIYNIEVPIDYNKIIIGPVNLERKELGTIINNIGKLITLRPTYKEGYFVFLLEDPELSRSFLDVLGRVKILDVENFTIRYCYKECILVNFYGYSSEFFNIPFVSSRIKTKVTFFLNIIEKNNNKNEIREFIYKKCKDLRIKQLFIPFFDLCPTLENPRVKGKDKVFIETYDIETSYNVYSILGGAKFKNKTILSGFYPEENYYVGEFE